MKKILSISALVIFLTACSVPDLSSSNSDSISINSSITTSISQSIPSTSLISSSSETTNSTSTPVSTSTTTSQSALVGISTALFSYLSDLPSTDAFLPDFLAPETYQTSLNLDGLNYYAGSINKSSLPSTYFGAQLDQLRTHIGFMDGFTNNLTTMLSYAATLGEMYQTYLSGQPTNPYAYTVQLGGFSFLITGLNEELILNVQVGSASVTFAVLKLNNLITYWVDIFISADNRLIIYTTPTRLVIIGNLEVLGVKVSYLLEILKSGNEITGYSYERYGTDSLAIKQHVVFKSVGNYFVVAGERGDFIPGASPKVNVETYDINTGKYLGSQVLETIPFTGPTYETIWYPMWSINGWQSIRFEEDNNDAKDFPQVYLNGSNNVFDVHYNSVLGALTSRKYDIELKKSYVYVTNNEGKLEKKEFLYPAFFIQQNELGSGPFGTANTRNNNLFSHTLTSAQLSAIRDHYQDMKTQQNAYKQIDVDQYITNFLTALNE
jgi:hypothetical protein